MTRDELRKKLSAAIDAANSARERLDSNRESAQWQAEFKKRVAEKDRLMAEYEALPKDYTTSEEGTRRSR